MGATFANAWYRAIRSYTLLRIGVPLLSLPLLVPCAVLRCALRTGKSQSKSTQISFAQISPAQIPDQAPLPNQQL